MPFRARMHDMLARFVSARTAVTGTCALLASGAVACLWLTGYDFEATYGVFLALCFIGLRAAPRRITVFVFVICVGFALIPWLGGGEGVFTYPSTSHPLPTLEIDHQTRLGRLFGKGVDVSFDVVAGAVALLGQLAPGGERFVFFPTGRIRPFAVFVVWSNVGCMAGLAILSKRRPADAVRS